jgi:2,3-bisphosphoglycerate-independent phosphoglycerate mutase
MNTLLKYYLFVYKKKINLLLKVINLRDRVNQFDEISCASGLLGRFCGGEVIKII